MASIYFELFEPHRPTGFRPGDQVAGLVHLNLSYDAAQYASHVEIAFSGRSEIECTVRISQREVVRSWEEHIPWHGNGRTVFFDHLQTVFAYDKAHLPALGAYQWPFAFTFPSQSRPSERLRRWQTSTLLPTFPSAPGLPLPPSFERYHDDWPATSRPEVHGWAEGRVSVIYELEARLVSTHGTYIGHYTRTVPFVPYSHMPAVEPRFYPKERRFYCESRQLMSKSDRLSFRSRAKSLVSKTPRLVFTIITELPAHAIMFEEMSVYLGIDYNLEHSTTEDLPPVLLREVRIGYLDQVELGFRQQMYSTERVTTIQSPPARKSVHCVFKKDQMVPITERMALRQILPPGRLVTDELSFETPNIRRYYHDLFITVTVVCAGEEFVASSRTEGRKFSFLPPALPPKGTELLASMVQPVEVPNGERYETESQAPLRELQGESLQELESRVPLVELPAGSPAR